MRCHLYMLTTSFFSPSQWRFSQKVGQFYLTLWGQFYFTIYIGVINNHLIPKLGSIPLAKLMPIHVQRYRTEALQGGRKDGRGLSLRTVQYHYRIK
ncbi:MAG: hypothetical protein AB2448_11420 [Moorella sp. (in: firmicutes)]